MRSVTLYSIMMLLAVQQSFAADAPAKHDANLPVEISANSLTVLQKESRAVFEGKVEAKQGEINLRSDKMTVHYRSGANRSASQNAIARIDVEGNVFVSTPKETAAGKEGTYNADDRVITLTGDVTLTQDGTIIKGDSLVYNLATGVSQIKQAGSTENKEDKRVYFYTTPQANKN